MFSNRLILYCRARLFIKNLMFYYLLITISERTILWYMTFWGFGMNFMLRMNLNIAIVSMVRPKTVKDGLKSEYYENHSLLQNISYLTGNRIDNVSIIFTNM